MPAPPAAPDLVTAELSRQELRALRYARRYSLALVFALLAPPWVRKAVVEVFAGMPGDAAVVLADWKAFGELLAPGWGFVRAG